jgi:hypothetical protein
VSFLSKALFAVAVGTALGLLATAAAVDRISLFGSVSSGPWVAYPALGSATIDPYARAALARSAYVPIGADEGLALTAARDDAGAGKRLMEFEAMIERHGGRLHVLEDGALVVAVTDADAATDQALKVARCALAVRALIGGFSLALVAGRATFSGPFPTGTAVERGVELDEERPPIGREQTAAVTGTTCTVRIDGNRPATLAEFATRSPVIAFHPEELSLSTGPAPGRRTLLDRLALFMDPTSADHRARYARALRARQQLLRKTAGSNPESAEIDAFEQLCAHHGAALTRARAAATLVRGKPTDQVPRAGRELAAVASALGYPDDADPGRFVDDYRRTTRHARTVVDRVFYEVD